MANNEPISDDNQSIDKLATNLSLEKPSNSDLSETNLDSNKEVTKVFQLLLTRVIEKQKNVKYKSFWHRLAPTFLIKISFIGAALSVLLFFISAVIDQTVVFFNIVISRKVLYFIIYLCFSILFLWSRLIWDIRQLKIPQKHLEDEFIVAMNEAGVNDWQLVEAVVKEANHQK